MIIKKIIYRSTLFLALLAFLGVVFAILTPLSVAAAAPTSVDAWWPTQGAHLEGSQPFKAMVPGLDVSQYDMFWQVDGGQWNWMGDNYQSYQHKEADVDVSQWTWHGAGPYVVNFIARQGNTVIAQQSETVYIDNGLPSITPPPPAAPTITATPPPAPVTVTITPPPAASIPAVTTSSNAIASASASATASVITNSTASTSVGISATVNSSISSSTSTASASVTTTASASVTTGVVSTESTSGAKLYVNQTSEAAQQALEWTTNNPSAAAAMNLLAAQPTAVWFGDWNSNVENDVHSTVTAAQAQGAVPVLVAYNIPERDCGSFSSGGATSAANYTSWIQSFASGIGSANAIVILEPDALSEISCLSQADQQTRLELLSSAVNTLKNNTNTKVYSDAGHANWIDATTMANNLTKANVADADGFSLNVSNFDATNLETQYGQQISAQIGGKHFVIDTSRNGNGSNGQWCNPSGMAIGQTPTTQTGNSLIDAYLWIKTPGESDGTCNGGPTAGSWWPTYALELVQNK